MEFENTLIDTSHLPRAEHVDLQPVAPKYFKVILYNSIIFWGIAGILIFLAIFFIDEIRIPIVIGISILAYLLLAGGTLFLFYLSFKNKGYAVRNHDVLYQTGWFIKTLHVCPFNRIQHCTIDSGLFERKFGLSKLKIYTAGGDDSDINIPGLTVNQAEDLRELILQKNLLNDSE